jgi:hypothetical protein
MAYMSQERKSEIAPKVKSILKKFGIKGSLSVRHHSTLSLTLKSGKIDFIGNSNRVCGNNFYQVAQGFKPNTNGYDSINPYWFHEHYDGDAKAFLTEVMEAMNDGNWDKSDIQSDYFNVGWYVDVNIGKWNANYVVEA